VENIYMERILFFSLTTLDEPTLQYSGSNSDDVKTLVGDDAKRMYVDITKKNLIFQFGSWDKVPDYQKTRLTKIIS